MRPSYPTRRFSTAPFLAIPALAAGLAACVAQPPSSPPAPRAPVTPPSSSIEAKPAAADWRDWRQTPGDWTYAPDSRGSRAMFRLAGADAHLILRCDRGERRMYLSRAGNATTSLTIRTTSIVRVLTVAPTGGSRPYVAAALAPGDPLLDAIAFSRGRIAIEQTGAPILVVPAWAEIGRVIEDCRG